MTPYLWVALGGAIGSMARFWMTIAMARLTGPAFPWGTLCINVLGAFVIGLFAALTGPQGRLPGAGDLRIFMMGGICGGFTTFSSFSLQTLDLLRDGRPLPALAYAGGSVMLCLVAVAAGYGAALMLAPRLAE
jgi:fluoride exporter